MTTEKAILAGGCFWGMQDLIRKLPGVLTTRVGYTGGTVPNATYRHHEGHAEAIEIDFDPDRISYRDLLEFFFQVHDPTTLNRQGNDVGTQYRSVIFYHTPEQRETAKHVIAEMANVWDAPLVTELSPLPVYYKAEEYHQNYFRQHPLQGYCAFVVAPKVSKFRKTFSHKLSES